MKPKLRKLVSGSAPAESRPQHPSSPSLEDARAVGALPVISMRYEPAGALAVDPSALGQMLFAIKEEPPAYELHGSVAVLSVVGPLDHHKSPFCASYDGIKERFKAAAADPEVSAILLSIDSPGGAVDGCFDTVTELRAVARESGKRVVTYVDAKLQSAAYALGLIGDEIIVPASGKVGSIGVFVSAKSLHRAIADEGIDVALIASGRRKPEGNPEVAISEEARAGIKAQVDELAAIFFALVSERRGIPVEAIAALEGASLIGQRAIAAGLADRIGTLDQAIQGLQTSSMGMVPAETEPSAVAAEKELAVPYDEMVKGLRALAENEDAPKEERENARKMLAALDEKEPEPKPEPAASDDQDDDDKPVPAPAASASSNTSAFALAGRVQALEAQLKFQAEAAERKELLAKRPDFTPEVKAFVETLPLKDLRKAVETFPRAASGPVGAAIAAVNATPTRASTEADKGLSPEERHALKVQMGLATGKANVRFEGNKHILGSVTPAEARAYLADLDKKGGV